MGRYSHAYGRLGQMRFNPEEHQACQQDKTCHHQPRQHRMDREEQREQPGSQDSGDTPGELKDGKVATTKGIWT
jgi:hypothetical protein